MLRLIIILIILGVSLYSKSVEGYYKDLQNITLEQRVIFEKIFSNTRNKREGLLFAAMAWQESSFGVFKRRNRGGTDNSYGIFHLTKEVIDNEMNDPNRYRLVMSSLKLQIKLARKQLKYWRRWRLQKGDPDDGTATMNAVACYNAGYNMKAGLRYQVEIVKKMMAIKQYLLDRNIAVR